MSRFIIQASANQPITVHGDGKQTRSFCYVTDTVSGLMLLTTSKEASGRVANIGNSEEITILELAQRIKKLTQSGSTLTFHPLPEDDPQRRCSDTSLVKRLLGWEPKISLGEGLGRTLSWFQRNM